MAEARYTRAPEFHQVLLDGTVGAYEVRQLPTGEAAFLDNATGGTSGQYVDFRKRGQATVAKATSVVLLKGQAVYWDHSANQATYRKVNDRDFLLGVMAEDATSAQTTAVVDLNALPRYDIDVARDAHLTSITGTQGLNTMGVFRRGGAHKFIVSATNEAQKLDILSVDGFAPLTANAIIEAVFRVVSGGAASAVDVSIGAASATHATDADSIAESLFVHLNSNDVNIYLECDDGSNETAATDSTIDYTAGTTVATRVHVLMDMRDPASVKMYVNGAQVLSGTTFNVSAAAATWFLLAHVEKTAATDTLEIDVEALRCWFAEQ